MEVDRPLRDPGIHPLAWQVPLLLAVAAVPQWLYVQHGINRLDEGWPLYAAMQLHAGGRLYDDVLWVFPPGHVLPAWLGVWLAPPGLYVSRIVYGLFDVGLCVALLVLGRRLMPGGFALLGALLVALAAPRSHFSQLLFAYRYLVLTVVALLCFARWLDRRDGRWMAAAGLSAGVALCFRLTPAFAVSCGIGLAVAASSRGPRVWVRAWSAYAAGMLAVLVPTLAWFGQSVGLVDLWFEVVEHPLLMLQPLDAPPIDAPELGDRASITRWFVAVQFRAHWLLYAAYALGLAVLYVRAVRRGQPFSHGLLLAAVVWGSVFFIRTLGRSDEAHLDSAIPPVCLLSAHAASLAFTRLWPARLPRAWRGPAAASTVVALVAAWVYLLGSDRYLAPRDRGNHVIDATRARGQPVGIWSAGKAREIDRVVRVIERRTRPGDVILDMSAAPLFHALSGRLGPGHYDVVMLGTFPDEHSERGFVERLRSDPPALVLWPATDFDGMPDRGPERTAPLLSAWVHDRYAPAAPGQRRWHVLLPRQ